MPACQFPVDQLLRRLHDPRELPRPRKSPGLSYGRHRGPAGTRSRVAAVAVTIYQSPHGGWTIPLTLRPQSLQHHGGQICLPGGRVEQDEEIFAAAMREFREELGVPATVLHRCAELSTQYVYASDNLVHPIVAIIAPPAPWDPDPAEVEEVIPLPLSVLLDDANRVELIKRRSVVSADREIGELAFRAPAFRFDDHLIWGATALILDQLARILRNPG